MKKGVLTRLVVHNILYSLKKNHEFFEKTAYENISKFNLNAVDKKFVINIVLTSLRENFVIKDIIKKFSKSKKISTPTYILLLSALTQIIRLNIKSYAVINCSVEVAKIKKIGNPSFINAILREIAQKKQLTYKASNYSNLPGWFKENTKDWNENTKNEFLETIRLQPNLHIVFKDEKKINKFNLPHILTTKNSIVIKKFNRVEELPYYKEGFWWVQDFSAMLPIYLLNGIKKRNVLDMCAAPGGKSFQIISLGNKIDIYEKNINRLKILKENLNRLGFKKEIKHDDSLLIKKKNFYDLVLLDAPCTSVGTIRKNPEIFFRNENINLEYYTDLQTKLLQKASELVKKNGIILYMVCSFLKKETNQQIYKFLKKNKNFKLEVFNNKNLDKKLFSKQGFLKTLPKNYNDQFLIDGFFAAKLIKYD